MLSIVGMLSNMLEMLLTMENLVDYGTSCGLKVCKQDVQTTFNKLDFHSLLHFSGLL